MEIEGSSLERVTTNFRTLALNEGMTGETVERLSKSPERALACLEAALQRGKGPGLAVHMFDAGDHPTRRERQAPKTNLHSAVTQCDVCDGDRFAVAYVREPQTSAWMHEHGIKANTDEVLEVYVRCPKCGAT